MSSNFKINYQWQMKFLPAIRFIVGPLLLEPAPFEIDVKEATDMLVLRARDMRIGCRVRRASGNYAERYPWEFTIRSHLDSGAKTELTKIVEGWGDWMLYAHAEHDDMPSLARWFLIDLASLRAHLIRNQAAVKPANKSNDDGTHFVAFDVRKFPPTPPLLVSSSHDVPIAKAA